MFFRTCCSSLNCVFQYLVENWYRFLVFKCILLRFAAKRPKTNNHPLAKPLPEGTVLTDLTKGEWKVGGAIGSGGFGLIYMGE